MSVEQYHVFTDGVDFYTPDHIEAQQVYSRFIRLYRVARLYIERYENGQDFEDDILESEDCLCAYGDYPL